MEEYTGSCHCKAVKFKFRISKDALFAWDCNCSICFMKRNVHIIVPSSQFELLEGESKLSTYTFNTHTAKHQFCKICGVQPFYIPRSNPDGYAITLYCIENFPIDSVEIKKFDARADGKWEQSFQTSGISQCSKE